MASRAALREVQGVELPEPGVWEIDAAHTSVEFVARHLMVAKVRGRFKDVSGTVKVGGTPQDSSVEVAISAASIDTANEGRDQHLRSPDFLDVEQYPTLAYRSTSAEQVGETTLRLGGDLTIRGVTKPAALEVEYQGLTRDPFGNQRAVFSAWTEIDREEFGITWNQALETGGVLVGKRVRVELEVEIIHKP